MFGIDVLTVVRQAVDRRGDRTGPATEHDVTGCYVQPRGVSDEKADQRLTVTSGWLAFAPPGSDVQPGDRVRWRGELYEVEGDAAQWAPPGGPAHHMEIVLQRVKG